LLNTTTTAQIQVLIRSRETSVLMGWVYSQPL